MSAARSSPVRPLVVGAIAGLIVGLLIGLLIGWVLWPVQYVGEAYTYELNPQAKLDYLAAVVDSYNLTGRLDVAQQRLNRWTPEEKISGLAMLFANYQVEGQMQEAQRVAELAGQLQRAEGWDVEVVRQTTSQVADQYLKEGTQAKAQAVTVFAGDLGATGVAVPTGAVPSTVGPEASVSSLSNVGLLLRACGVLLLLIVLVLAVLILRSRGRGPRRRPAAREAEAEMRPLPPSGPQPLLQKTSSYKLGMDNFDESFAIETKDDEWLGECGMGISESVGNGTPRHVVAFEVWLFDKINTRTVTKVLMSDFVNTDDETLRNKLATRGEPVLATPGQTFTLDTPSLTVEARVVEMEYGEGTPAFGYFENLKVSLTVYRKPQAEASGETA
jgi:hypothetical protein